jgi:WD40 repeat protein
MSDDQNSPTAPSLHIDVPFAVAGAALVAGGSQLVAGGREGTVRSWDAATGRVLTSLKYEGPVPTDVAHSKDGKLIAVAGADHSVRVLAAATLRERRAMEGVSRVQEAIRFSPDARFLAGVARSHELDLTVWEVSSGAPLPSFHDASAAPSAIAFSPDNSTVAVGTLTGDILVLETKRQAVVRTLTEPLMACLGMAFSADGRLLVAASLDGVLFVWDRATWSVRRFPAPRGSLEVAVSPAGTHLAARSGSFNPGDSVAEALLLRWPSGEVVARQPLGVVSDASLAFVSAGQVRVAAARGKAIQVWNLG